ncbi:protein DETOXIFICATION 46, chloroplastic-like [Panicum miliaceum]|uniref:Protein DETOXIFICATION n=1 Tax=Panicum miliaceum TaxID=4540 RepID=A0A3L6QHJ6_PANMI|nr:protein DETOXIFICATION 46, chloroplastic-like [Panicum miliaceum]
MSAHLRLLSAAHLIPAPASLHRLRQRLPAPPPPAARLRLLRPPRLEESPRLSSAARCRCAGSAVARVAEDGGEQAAAAGIWEQVRDIVVFAGPALGLWICGPLMSLIDTMVIGQTSALQLAALGPSPLPSYPSPYGITAQAISQHTRPGTVFCDYLSYIFMFLSVATSNMVATSLAKKDKELVQHQVSMLLFIALACGIGMFLFTKVFGTQALSAFAGSGNYEIISSANTYAQIRGFAWPAVLVGLVAQSASLGMKDSWGPLKALAAATVVNGVGDILLCSVCGFGIAGAAWATMVSQVVAAFMMMQNLNNKGFQAFSFTIPSARELLQIFEIAAPVFVTMTSKVAFYALLTYSATSLGAVTLAAHQVMINILCMCTVWGEPLSQTAQSFMPELIYGANRNLTKARMLLKSLVIIGVIAGAVLGAVGTLVPWLFPSLFTNDRMVVQQMHRVLAPYFSALLVTPSVHSLEGTLLAGRDLRYLSQSMGVCFCIGTLLLMSRFASGLQRLISPMGMLYNENFNQVDYIKTKAT